MENKNEQIPVFLTERMMRKIMEDKECVELIIHTFLQLPDLKIIPNTYDCNDNIYALDGNNNLCRIILRTMDFLEGERDFLNPFSGNFANDKKCKNYVLIFDEDFPELNQYGYFYDAEIKKNSDKTICYYAELTIINVDYTGNSPFSHLLSDLKCGDSDKIRNRTLRRRIKEILSKENGTEEHE